MNLGSPRVPTKRILVISAMRQAKVNFIHALLSRLEVAKLNYLLQVELCPPKDAEVLPRSTCEHDFIWK